MCVERGRWREDVIIREKRPRINEVGFNSAGKWQRNTVEEVESFNMHWRKYNSASSSEAKWNIQVLIGQGRREVIGVFGWLGHVVGTEGLDKIIVFIISSVYLTVCHEASASRCFGNCGLVCFPYKNMMRVVTMAAANDSELVTCRMSLRADLCLQTPCFSLATVFLSGRQLEWR